MALERLARTAPELTRYILSFKDMTDELPEGSSVQVGVFILKQGASQFYVPVIAKSGTVYPIDSIYMADRKCFFPLTSKTVEQITSNQNASIGKASRIPDTAVRNPNLKELIVPPRTGKFIYAGTSRLGEMVTMLKPNMRSELSSLLETDSSLNEALNRVLNVPDLLEALKAPTNMVESPSICELPQVVTDGHGLGHEAIQDILNKGYHVKGTPVVTRTAVESFGGESFTTIGAAEHGHGYVFVTRTGEDVHGVVLNTEGGDKRYVALEDGDICILNKNVVIKQQEVDPATILVNIPTVNVMDIAVLLPPERHMSRNVMVYDGTKYYAVRVTQVVESSDSITYMLDTNGSRSSDSIDRIVVSVGMHGKSDRIGNTLFLSPTCKASLISSNMYSKQDMFETDLSVAIRRDQARKLSLLPECHIIRYHKGHFSYDGHAVGDKPAMAKKLIEEVKLDPESAEYFMKKASEEVKLEIFMSKEAAEMGTKPTPFVEYGEKLQPDSTGTGTARDRARNSMATAKIAANTKDQQVVEATIMSELLADPDMLSTIADYLGDIESAIDKLGRILFLSRVNSEKLSEQMDPEALSNLITTIRNSYRTLGENYIKLENITRNV